MIATTLGSSRELFYANRLLTRLRGLIVQKLQGFRVTGEAYKGGGSGCLSVCSNRYLDDDDDDDFDDDDGDLVVSRFRDDCQPCHT